MLEGRHHDAPCRARHSLHISQNERSSDGVRFPCTPSSHDDRDVSPDELSEPLRAVEIHFLHIGGQDDDEVGLKKEEITVCC